MVLRVAALAEALPAGAGERQRGRVEEHHREFAEQVAPAREQLLLDAVLDRARGERGGAALLLGGEFLAEPSHGAVEVVEAQAVHTGDVVVGEPRLAGPVRARDHDPVQHGGEDGALDRELEAASGQEILDDGAAAGLLPQPPEQKGRAGPIRNERRSMMFPLVVRAPHASLLPYRPKRNLGSLQHPPNLHCRPRSTSCGRNTVRLPRFRGSPALCVDQAATCAVPVDGLDVAPRHGTKKVHPSSHGGRRSRSKGWSIPSLSRCPRNVRENLSGHLSHKSQRCPRSRVNPSSGSFQPPPGTLGVRASTGPA